MVALAVLMSKRGKEKKAAHVAKVHARKAACKEVSEMRLEPRNKAALGMPAPWKRKITEALKKRNRRRL